METVIKGKDGVQIASGKNHAAKPGMTASDVVMEIVRDAAMQGVGFSEIQAKTGFGEKKIRNIVFRLNKLGKIKRKSRGIYVVASHG